MASIEQIRASDGTANASVATVQTTRAPLASTIIVDTVAGINPDGFAGSMGTPHTFTDPITSEEITVISEATAVDFTGHIDGSNIEIDDIAPGYTDNGSEVGDIVIIRPTTQYADNLADVLAESHDDDGALNATALGQVYPIGSIYTSTVATNPGTLLGFGTWVAFGEGRVMVGKAAAGTFATGGATGGEETHTLTTPEMPAHTHNLSLNASSTAGGVAHYFAGNGAGSSSPATTSTGGGGAHNNLQPYIVVYMWNRTA